MDDETPWAEDDACWYFVACHPDGLTLEQIGVLQDTTRERVRQIEQIAIRKIRNTAVRMGLNPLELFRHLGVDPSDLGW